MTHDKDFDAVQALGVIRSSQAEVAERFTRGGWVYDVIYALIVGEFVAGMALPVPLIWVNEAVVAVLLIIIVRWWKQRTGVWLNGIRPVKARWVAIGLSILSFTLMATSYVWSRHGGGFIAPLVCGTATAVLAFAAARLWTGVYRREAGLDR